MHQARSLSARSGLSLAFSLAFVAASLPAQDGPPQIDLSKLHTRALGPATMSGRVVDLAVDEKKPTKFYVATASGGLWKTVNNGQTFTPLFQNEKVISIGDIAIDPNDSERIWVGTGEANNRNSSSWGNGVYFSSDGGKTWKHKGLDKSFHIGRIAIDPKDPGTVFVAALGKLWGPNKERGLYRTKDGGENWELVLEHDAKTGATEVRIDPSDSKVVYCALYERQRDGYDGNHPIKRWGPGSGLFRSTDGGDTWTKCTKGLPTCKIGRISMDIYRKDPRKVFALIETEKIGTRPQAPADPNAKPEAGTAFMGFTQSTEARGGLRLDAVVEGGPAAKAGIKQGDVVISVGGTPIPNYDAMTDYLAEARAGEKAEVKVLRGEKLEKITITWGNRADIANSPGAPGARGGRGGRRGARSGFADRIGGQVANRQRQQGEMGFETGGIYLSEDKGATWKRINSLNPRPYYFSQIRVDPSDDKNIYVCGIQFHWSFDGGERFSSRTREITMAGVHVDYHAMWVNPSNGRHAIIGSDGGVYMTYDRLKSFETFANLNIGQAYHAVADTRRPYWVYAGFQDNGSWGWPSETPYSEGVLNQDVFKIGGGDGFVCRVDRDDPNVVFSESQGGIISWRNIVTGQRGSVSRGGNMLQALTNRRQRGRRGSFNWNTPFLLSHFNQKTIYFAGDKVYRSVNRGRSTMAISPKITGEIKEKISAGNPSATTLSESRRRPGILWVGTDDGKLWTTQDDGRNWSEVTKALVAKLPDQKPMWVGKVWASSHKTERAYVVVDGHRSANMEPHVFVTEDFGKEFTSIAADLPAHTGSARSICEDTRNPDLLYLGTEMGLWFSLDRGKTWQRHNAVPSTSIHDFDIQERDQHLIVATHGRGVYAVDIRPLRALTTANRKKDAYLVKPGDVYRLRRRSRSKQGSRHHRIPNPPTRATFYYHLAKNSKDKAKVTVRDALGKDVWVGEGAARAGLNRVDWGLTRGNARGGVRGAAARAFGGFRRGRGRGIGAGVYSVTIEIGKTKLVDTFQVEDANNELDTMWPRPTGVGEGNPLIEEASSEVRSERRGG